MKNTISYAGLQGEAKKAKAIQDTRDYLGNEMWHRLLEYLATCRTQKEVSFGCGFVGVEGYPATALYQQYVEKSKEIL